MKKIILFLFSALSSVAFAQLAQTGANSKSLQGPPLVEFKGNVVSGCGPLCVTFINSSQVKGQPGWDFGDGTTSLSPGPTHCYSNPGSYSVTLTMDTGSSVISATKTGYITVFPKPGSDFSFSPSAIYSTTPVAFTDLSVAATNWLWNFGDPADATKSTSKNPSHAYTDTGTYCITLIGTSVDGCKDTVTHCLQVIPGTIGIKNFVGNEFAFSVQPNPSTNGYFSVKLNSSLQEKRIVVYDILGEIALQLLTIKQGETIDLSNMQAGIYFLTVYEGSQEETQKIINLRY